MLNFRTTYLVLGAILGPGLTSCGSPDVSPNGGDNTATAETPLPVRYNREYVFVGSESEMVVLAPFTFRATDNGVQLQRVAQGWLSRGPTWDRFLDASGVTVRAGGVWRVVPIADLRVIAGGPAELESIRFARAERRLRLDLGTPLSEWNQGGDTRFRLLDGRLTIGSEIVHGPVLELLRVEQTAEDGWPTSESLDFLYLVSGDSLQLVMSSGNGGSDPPFTWIRTRADERVWDGGEVERIEVIPLQEARRDIPQRWSIGLTSVGLVGELEGIGYDVLLGPERGGRRAIEIRYSVTGFVRIEEFEWPITGLIRHVQQ